MRPMARGARSFHQPLSSGDVGAVSELRCMANDAEPFHRSLWSWNGNVGQHMFYNATSFHQPLPSREVGQDSDTTSSRFHR